MATKTTTTTRTTMTTFFLLLSLSPFLSNAQYLPPGRVDFFSEYSGVTIANQELKGYLPPASVDFLNEQSGIARITALLNEEGSNWGSAEIWKSTDGKFQSGKIYKGTIRTPGSLIEMPGGEKLKGIISKGDLAVLKFNTPDEMEIFLPKQKIQLALMGDTKNKTIKFKQPPVKL